MFGPPVDPKWAADVIFRIGVRLGSIKNEIRRQVQQATTATLYALGDGARAVSIDQKCRLGIVFRAIDLRVCRTVDDPIRRVPGDAIGDQIGSAEVQLLSADADYIGALGLQAENSLHAQLPVCASNQELHHPIVLWLRPARHFRERFFMPPLPASRGRQLKSVSAVMQVTPHHLDT